MNKKLIALLLMFTSYSLFAQTNWRDSVKVKKVMDAYELKGFIYFKTKKGWGACDKVSKKILVKPKYSFLIAAQDDDCAFYYIQNGKIGLLDSNGLEMGKPKHKRKGTLTYLYDEKKYAIADDDVFEMPAKVKASYASDYFQLSKAGEFSITVIKNLVLFNDYVKEENHLPYVTNNFTDSLDENGNLVYPPPVVHSNSGVFDLNQSVWKQGKKYGKYGYIGEYIMGSSSENGVDYVKLLDQDLNTVKTIKEDTLLNTPKNAKAMLGSYAPTNIQVNEGSNYAVFYSNQKCGLYDHSVYKVKIEPTEFDFLFLSETFPRYIFTVKNGKIGVLLNQNYTPLYNCAYDAIEIRTTLRNNEISDEVITCNEFDPDLFVYNELKNTDSLKVKTWTLFEPITATKVDGDHVIVKEYYPLGPAQEFPIQIIDEFGDVKDSTSIDPVTGQVIVYYPPRSEGYSKGGVFNLKTKKWIVPQKYTNIVKHKGGFACMRYYADSLTYAYYTLNGDLVFQNMSIDKLKEDKKSLMLLLGINGGANAQFDWCEKMNTYGIMQGLPVVCNVDGKSGVMDLISFKWVLPFTYSYVDRLTVVNYYMVFKDSKVGLFDLDGKTVLPIQFRKIRYCNQEALFICNDSIAFLENKNFELAKVDTMNIPCSYRLPEGNKGSLVFNAQLNKAICEVTEYNDVYYQKFDENGYSEAEDSREFNGKSRVIHLNGQKRIQFHNAFNLRAWTSQYVYENENNNWFYGADEKNVKELCNASVVIEGDLVYCTKNSKNFTFNDKGGIREATNQDLEYGDVRVIAVTSKQYTNGSTVYTPPNDFVALAMNKNATALGFKIEYDGSKSINVKKYYYYDFNTKDYTPCEIPFDEKSFITVQYVAGDYLVVEEPFFDAVGVKVWVLNQDLKTIKSEFLKLKKIEYEVGWCNINPEVIAYLLHERDGRVMIFDKNFQFLHEAINNDIHITSTWFNTFIKTRSANLKINHEGKVLGR